MSMRQGKGKMDGWMDGWTDGRVMTGYHSVRMMMPDLQGDAAGISLSCLCLSLSLSLSYVRVPLSRGIRRGYAMEHSFPILPDVNANARSNRQPDVPLAVMMTWEGER